MTNTKFAGLRRIAAEEPQVLSTAIETLKTKVQTLADNLETMQAHLSGNNPVPDEPNDDGLHGEQPFAEEEGIHVPVPAGDEEGTPLGEAKPVMANLKRIAAKAPEMIEEALGEFYLGMDEVLALTENLADHLDVELPVGENPMGSPDGDGDADDVVAFEGTADKDTLKKIEEIGGEDDEDKQDAKDEKHEEEAEEKAED